MVEKELYLGQISEIKHFNGHYFLRSLESENYIFYGSSVRVSVISITQKQIIAKTYNFVFYISVIGRWFSKPFMKIE